MSIGCTYKFFDFSISYTILNIPLSISYLWIILFNPRTFSPILPFHFPADNPPNDLHTYDSVSVLLVCLVCFLDSIVDSYVLIAILMFIALIFFLSPFNISYNNGLAMMNSFSFILSEKHFICA